MGYDEFKEKILEELRDYFGDSTEVYIERVMKNNGLYYDGIKISRNGQGPKVIPVIRLAELYEEYGGDGMDMGDCVQAVLKTLENNEVPESMERFIERIKEWDFIRNYVYPILLSTKENEELLQNLVSTPMLDMSVAYIIRAQVGCACDGNVKISKSLMENYGISTEQLHRQAIENLEKDGYEFREMDSVMRDVLPPEVYSELQKGKEEEKEMHMLTNACKSYGAAGILDKELLKKFAGEQDYFILPSSIHETIFVPVTDDGIGKKDLDNMVAEVNATQVRVEERLTDHSYYYDAGANEIRLCA